MNCYCYSYETFVITVLYFVGILLSFFKFYETIFLELNLPLNNDHEKFSKTAVKYLQKIFFPG